MILFWNNMEFNGNNSLCITFASVDHPPSIFKCPNVQVHVSVAVVRMHGEEGRCGPYVELALGNSSVLKMSAAGLWCRQPLTTPFTHYTCRGNLIKVSFGRYFIRKVKVKWSRYRPGLAQSVGRGIALLFHDRGTRRGWVVSSTPRPHFTPWKDPVPILQEAGWAPGSVWTGGKSRPHRDSIPDHTARSSVAIPTELPVPRYFIGRENKLPSKQ